MFLLDFDPQLGLEGEFPLFKFLFHFDLVLGDGVVELLDLVEVGFPLTGNLFYQLVEFVELFLCIGELFELGY